MRLFTMKSCPARVLFAQAGAALALAALIGGCGNNYRPVVTPIGTNGPPAQATSYAIVVSTTGTSTPGVVTIIDYSGDAIMNERQSAPDRRFSRSMRVGADGYTINSNGTLSNFALQSSLQAKNVSESTLPPAAEPVNLMSPSNVLFATDLNGDVADLFNGSPQAFKLRDPVATAGSPATMPVMVAGVGTNGGQRDYVLSQDVPDTAAARLPAATPPILLPCRRALLHRLSSPAPRPIPLSRLESVPCMPFKLPTNSACMF